VLFWTAKSIYNLFFHPLASYPGPWLSRTSRLHYVYHQLNGTLPYKTLDWHDKYGEVVRVAPDELSYNSARAYQEIHSWRNRDFRSGFEKDPTWYSQSMNTVPVIVTARNEDHGRLRGIMAHAFSDRALARQEPLITSYVDILIQQLHENQTQKSVDLVPWLTSAAMDVILDLSFGRSLGCLTNTENGKLHPWVELVSGHVKQGLYIQAWRRLPSLLSRNWLVGVVLGRIGRKWMKQFMLTTEMAQQRLAAGADREDFVSHFLRENQQQNGKTEMTEAELKIASSILMTAGSDTNATLLCGCLYYVLNDEQVWNRLATEVRTEYSREADITFASLQNLPYLNAVIEEALRIYPVVPSTFPRRTAALGATIVGQFVPADYAIGINGYAASRSATNFTLPDKFCPERWLGDPRFQRDEKKAHQPFSTGPRNCLGKNLAWAFARLTIARFVWSFDAKLTEDSKDWASGQEIYVMFAKKPLWCQIEARKIDSWN
ncbi:hypothetical protein N7467_004435, partial [Penicillium canescens]